MFPPGVNFAAGSAEQAKKRRIWRTKPHKPTSKTRPQPKQFHSPGVNGKTLWQKKANSSASGLLWNRRGTMDRQRWETIRAHS